MATNEESNREGHEYGINLNYGTLHQGDIYTSMAYKSDDDPKIKCRDALLLTDPNIDRETLKDEKGKRTSGTCEWIKEDETYVSWLKGKLQCLWISGGPGKGKTILSIFLTEELERECPQDTTIFYFCISGNKDRNNAAAVLRGLAYQVLKKHPDLSKYVSSYFETSKETEIALSSPEFLWTMFVALLQSPELGTVFCVLDGLDECNDESIKKLVNRFRDFYSVGHSAPGNRNLRLAIVSRKIFGLDPFPQVRLDPDNDGQINKDVQQFVTTSVQELSRLPGFNADFRKNVEDSLLSRSEGTFLWVGFVMDELLRKTTCTEVIDTLKILPRGLPATYSRMLRRTESNRRPTISAILIWVTMAIRPLTMDELKMAVPILCNVSIPSEQAMRDHIALCGPILKIHERQISLVHQSARDYLLREGTDNDSILEEFRIKAEETHYKLANICLDYIENSELQSSVLDIEDVKILERSPFINYAAMYWGEHARRASTLAGRFALSRPLFQEKSTLQMNWWKAYRKATLVHLYTESYPAILHIACFFGIASLVQKLLSKASMFKLRKSANKRDKIGRPALYYALHGGHEAIVQLLLQYGADVNAKGDKGFTALMIAAPNGQEVIVKLLLLAGADINAKIDKGCMALMLAALSGQEVVVQLLLQAGGDVNAKDNTGFTALMFAASNGHEGMVQLLLQASADINAKENTGFTALMLAALNGQEIIVQLLLQAGANVNAKHNIGFTALTVAAIKGDKVIVELLKSAGALE